MNDKYTDELLIKGLSKLKELEFANIPIENEIEYQFTESYIVKQERLLNKLSHTYWKYVNTVAKKVAIIIITFIIAFSSLMTVDAFRDKFLFFVYKIYSSFTQIESEEDIADKIISQYYTIYSPALFEQTSIVANEYMAFSCWTDTLQREISLAQFSVSDSYKFNSEHGELTEKIINDTPCLICKDPNLYYCYWEFDGYRFELIYPVDLGEEFMSEVVGHLIKVNPEELTTE